VRHAARTDDNQARIVNALRRAGCHVLSLAAVGNGCGDLLITRGGTIWMLECKDGDKSPSRRRLTRHQELFHQNWPVRVVCSEDEALAVISEEIKQKNDRSRTG